LIATYGDALYADLHSQNAYMSEVQTALIEFITDERYQGKLVIILAGYVDAMAALMECNPGLPRRFPNVVHFRDFTTDDTVELFKRVLSSEQYAYLPMTTAASAVATSLAQTLVEHVHFANGGTVNTWAQATWSQVAVRTQQAKREAVASAASSLHGDERLVAEQFIEEKLRFAVTVDDLKAAHTIVYTSMPVPQRYRGLNAAAAAAFVQGLSAIEQQQQQSQQTHYRQQLRIAPVAAIEASQVEAAFDTDATIDSIDEESSGSSLTAHERNGIMSAAVACGMSSEASIHELRANEQHATQLAHELHSEAAKVERILQLLEEERLEIARQIKEQEAKELADRLEAERMAAELEEQSRIEEARQLREQEERRIAKQIAIQKALSKIGLCEAGYQWLRVSGGWRCSAGGHFCSDAEVQGAMS
jgi:hypothetical protein